MSRILFDSFDSLVPLVAAPVIPAPSFSFSPPGAIGLPAQDAIILLRFDETATTIQPKDDAGTLTDPWVQTGLNIPAVVDGACGRARRFVASSSTGIVASDLVSGTSLLTRDVTVQVIMSLDVAAQSAALTPGTIMTRGKSNSVAEYVAFGLELVVDDAATLKCTMRWFWQDAAGTLKTQAGAQFIAPASGFMLLTATRRWLSPTSVALRYYAGDVFLGEVLSVDGSIGGGTTGQTLFGTFFSAGLGHAINFLAGTIDELLVVDRELTREEIEATWLRITRYQPLGYQLIRELHDPGFPLPTDPGSDVQLDLRMTGNGLGYAAAQAESVRVNILPQRAFGSVLEDWEEATRVTPQPSDGIDERRARVVAKIRQRRGCTPPGLQDALVGLLGGADVDQLEFLAFSNEIDDAFATIDPLRWDVLPNGGGGKIAAVAGAASFQPGAGSFFMDGLARPPSWVTMRQIVGGDGKQAHQLTKLIWTTPQANAEAGIYFENAVTRDYLLLGLRDLAGSFRVETESFIAGVSQGVVQQAIIGANPAAIWLHLYQTTVDGTWKAAWSTTGATSGFTVSADITHPTVAQWGGCYVRAISALGAGPRADFDDHRLYMPFSGRPFNAYVLLDRALGFAPDIDGNNSVISAIKHGFIHAAFVTNRVLLAGDPDTGAGLAPTGGY